MHKYWLQLIQHTVLSVCLLISLSAPYEQMPSFLRFMTTCGKLYFSVDLFYYLITLFDRQWFSLVYIVHHLAMLVFQFQWDNVRDPDLAWFAFWVGGMVELSAIVFPIDFFARRWDWHRAYFISGVLKYTMYPSIRLLFMPYWCAYYTICHKRLFEKDGLLHVYYYQSVGSLFIILLSVVGFLDFCLHFREQFYISTEKQASMLHGDGSEWKEGHLTKDDSIQAQLPLEMTGRAVSHKRNTHSLKC